MKARPAQIRTKVVTELSASVFSTASQSLCRIGPTGYVHMRIVDGDDCSALVLNQTDDLLVSYECLAQRMSRVF